MDGGGDAYRQTELLEMESQYSDQLGFQRFSGGLLDHQADFEDRAENDVEGLGSRVYPIRLILTQS